MLINVLHSKKIDVIFDPPKIKTIFSVMPSYLDKNVLSRRVIKENNRYY